MILMGPADEMMRVRVDGAAYEINLSSENAAALPARTVRRSCPQGRRGQRRRPVRAAGSRDRGGSIRGSGRHGRPNAVDGPAAPDDLAGIGRGVIGARVSV